MKEMKYMRTTPWPCTYVQQLGLRCINFSHELPAAPIIDINTSTQANRANCKEGATILHLGARISILRVYKQHLTAGFRASSCSTLYNITTKRNEDVNANDLSYIKIAMQHDSQKHTSQLLIVLNTRYNTVLSVLGICRCVRQPLTLPRLINRFTADLELVTIDACS